MSCMSSRYEILFLTAKALLVQFKSNVELTEGAGHWLQHHSSDESHVLAFFFFFPSQSIISHCLQRRNPFVEGGLTLRVVTQSVPVGCGSGAGAPVGAAESGGWCRGRGALPHGRGHGGSSSF